MSDTVERQFGDLKVVIDRGTCIATENFIVVAPEVFEALVHESKLARHGSNHRCFIDRWRKKLGGPCRSSRSACCTRAALRPFVHRVSWLEDHRR